MRRIVALKTTLPVHNLGTAALETRNGLVFEPETAGVTINTRDNRSFFVSWDKIAWCSLEPLPAAKKVA